MPTAEQAWQEAMPRGTELVAGQAGLYNGISWVVRLRPTPPGFDRLRGEELALFDSKTIGVLGSTMPELVATLAEQGASAIGILGAIEPEDREQADRFNIPILQLPTGTDLSALEANVNAMIGKERSLLYQRERELTRLMEMALAGQGVEAILEKLETLSGRTALLLGPGFEPMGSHSEIPELQKTLSRHLPSPPAKPVGLKLTDRFAGFLSPVSGKFGVEGYLLIVAPVGELQESDRLAVKTGALAVAVELSHDQAVVDTEGRFQAEMAESMLSGELSDQAIVERAQRLGLDLSKSYATIVLQLSGSNQRADVVARKARTILGDVLCHPRGSTLVVVYPVAAPGNAPDLRRIAREVARKMSDYLGAAVSLGIGRAYAGPEGPRTSFGEAERALTMGRRLFGSSSVNFFGDLGVYRLLLAVDRDEITAFYQESVGLLAEYDRKHSGELLVTLEALLRYHTISETAQVLHVHRNTLLYRIQRIQNIIGLDLDDGETRLTLHLGLKAGDVIRIR